MKNTPQILSDCLNDLYLNGFTTASGGNISQIDDEGNIWISPSQIDKGFLTDKQFACFKNYKWVGEFNPSMEHPFHLSIYEHFPEAHAICHLHPPALVALSCIDKEDVHFKRLMSDLNLAYADYAIPGSEQLGDNIVNALHKNPEGVLMQNHGIIAFGEDILDAANKIKKLEKKLQNALGVYSFMSTGPQFDEEKEETFEYYKNRMLFFLGIKEEHLELGQTDSGLYYSLFKQNLYCDITRGNGKFESAIIPECYLLLKDPVFNENAFDRNNLSVSLNSLSEQSPISFFEDGRIIAIGNTLFNLYDRVEVLVFCFKVLMYAKKIGKLNKLTYDQILELKSKFLT